MNTLENGSSFIMKPDLHGNIFVYWMKNQHVEDLIELQTYSTETFLDRKDFVSLLKKEEVQGYVAYCLTQPVGFVLFELEDDSIQILNLVIHPKQQRKKVGTYLLKKVKDRMRGRERVSFTVRESNLPGQLFLHANDFKVINTLKGFFQDWWDDSQPEVEDGYEFQFVDKFLVTS